MKPPANEFTQYPQPLLEDVEGAAARAIGLLHLLAVSFTSKEDRHGGPTQSEADGIHWLTASTGAELERTLEAALQLRVVAPAANHQSSSAPAA